MNYKMTITEKQLIVIQNAVEEYFRLRMGQDSMFSDDMAEINVDLSPENPNHKMIFDRFICRRDALSQVMRAFYGIAFERGNLEKKTEDMLIAEDIWDAIRFARGISRWGSVLNVSGEPTPKVEKETE